MQTPHVLLDHLSRDELIALADRCALQVADRRVKAQLIEAAARLPRASLDAYLSDLARDRLKELCRALDLDDSGREKAVIIDRLLGSAPDFVPGAPRCRSRRRSWGEEGEGKLAKEILDLF